MNTTVHGRDNAVSLAQSLSSKTHHPVKVERRDSAIKMRFRRGSLLEYAYDTRAARRS